MQASQPREGHSRGPCPPRTFNLSLRLCRYLLYTSKYGQHLDAVLFGVGPQLYNKLPAVLEQTHHARDECVYRRRISPVVHS